MKLVNTLSGDEVKVGHRVHMHNGGIVEITDIVKPHKPSSTGRVYVKDLEEGWTASYFPSVVGAKWIERDDQ